MRVPSSKFQVSSFALIALLALAGCATLPPPRPVAEYVEGPVTITLSDEPCALAAVTNLPYRATWRDTRGVFEGCFDIQHGSVVALYFDDRTVVTAPLRAFGPPAAPEPAKPLPIAL